MSFAALEHGVSVSINDRVRRVTAPNPGPLTGPGTNTYLLGSGEVIVIDPGPLIESHCQAILDAAGNNGGHVKYVLVTHTHPDHSPAAMELARATGAPVLGMAPPDDGYQDTSFCADLLLADGDVVRTDEVTVDVVHTPGHASNHLCFVERQSQLLFTGDHVMNGSTVVILPPDGCMASYIESLGKIRALNCAAIAPGHGAVIEHPESAIDWIVQHRLERERKVLDRLGVDDSLDDLVKRVYDDVPGKLHALAKRSLLAHLIKLHNEQRVSFANDRWSRRSAG